MSVRIQTPAPGTILRGKVQVSAVYDGARFDVATCTLAGQQLASDPAQPITFSIDTARVPDGQHTLTVAVRYRTAGGPKRWQKASITVQVANAASSEWSRVASEGQSFSIAEAREVRYGAGTAWTSKILSPGNYACTNAFFGDPAPGVSKVCETRATTEDPDPEPEPEPGAGVSLTTFADVVDVLGWGKYVNRWDRRGQNAFHGDEVTSPPWPSTGGPSITELPGGGFRFQCNGEMVAFSSGSKAIMLNDQEHLLKRATCIGSEFVWEADYTFPRAGNPDGWAQLYDVNALLEFSGDSFVANQCGIDGPRNCIYARTYDAPSNRTRVLRATSHPIRWDVPMHVKVHWRFSYGADGFLRLDIDGQRIGEFTGQTMEPGKAYQAFYFGYYSSQSPGRNEIIARNIRVKVTAPQFLTALAAPVAGVEMDEAIAALARAFEMSEEHSAGMRKTSG